MFIPREGDGVVLTHPFYNLVPRVSLLCLPWSLEERPWLRLVTLPPRIWVAKNSVGWEGWQSVLFG